jgi:hypothetical protein
MQWEYQVCPSRLFNGMAVTFSKEALRALQDAFSIYETLFSEHATNFTTSSPVPACRGSYGQKPGNMVEGLLGDCSLVWLLTVCNKTSLEVSVLVQRWRMALELFND